MFRIAICDDDKDYIVFLEQIIQKCWTLEGKIAFYEYTSGEVLLSDLDKEHDLIFLDIQMGELNGNETARMLRKVHSKTELVFCTGIKLPTPEVFKVQPYRYLMKQFSDRKMEREITDILEEMVRRKEIVYFDVISDGQIEKVNIDDIVYISITKRGCSIWIKNGREIYSSEHISKVYERIGKCGFEFVQKSFLVNFKYIIKATSREVLLINNIGFNISRHKKEKFYQRFTEYLGVEYGRNSGETKQ